MSEYNINTLFGDTPIKDNNTDFVMGSPTAKIWKVVVQTEKDGKVIQRDESLGMDLTEAIGHANNLRTTYRVDGYVETEEGLFDGMNGDFISIFVV